MKVIFFFLQWRHLMSWTFILQFFYVKNADPLNALLWMNNPEKNSKALNCTVLCKLLYSVIISITANIMCVYWRPRSPNVCKCMQCTHMFIGGICVPQLSTFSTIIFNSAVTQGYSIPELHDNLLKNKAGTAKGTASPCL